MIEDAGRVTSANPVTRFFAGKDSRVFLRVDRPHKTAEG